MTIASMRIRSLAAVLLWGSAIVACSTERSSVPVSKPLVEPRATIESSGPAWSDGERWRLTDPFLDTSATIAGAPNDGLLNVTGAVVLDDGLLVASDRTLRQVRYLSLDGTVQQVVGRHGNEPGTFSASIGLHLFPGHSPGTVVAGDYGNGRVHLIGPNGSSITSVALAEGRLAGVFGDGTWLVKVVGPPSSRSRPGPVNYDVRYRRHAADGRPLTTIATTDAPGRFVNSAGRISDYLMPLTAEPTVVAAGNQLWVLPGTDSVVDGYDLDGTLRLRHRWPLERRTSDEVRARIERSFLRMPEADRSVLQTFPIPDVVPAYRNLLADDDGNLWLERYRQQREPGQPRAWDIVNAERGWLGTIETPHDVVIHHIANDMVLGLVEGEQRSVHLRAYRLVKPRELSARSGRRTVETSISPRTTGSAAGDATGARAQR